MKWYKSIFQIVFFICNTINYTQNNIFNCSNYEVKCLFTFTEYSSSKTFGIEHYTYALNLYTSCTYHNDLCNCTLFLSVSCFHALFLIATLIYDFIMNIFSFTGWQPKLYVCKLYVVMQRAIKLYRFNVINILEFHFQLLSSTSFVFVRFVSLR